MFPCGTLGQSAVVLSSILSFDILWHLLLHLFHHSRIWCTDAIDTKRDCKAVPRYRLLMEDWGSKRQLQWSNTSQIQFHHREDKRGKHILPACCSIRVINRSRQRRSQLTPTGTR
jgi:hypothetical protein